MTDPGLGVVLELQGMSLSEGTERARLAEKLGMRSCWLVQLPNQRDSATVLAALAAATETITVGSGILPIYTRPPVVMAQTAATLDELSGGRFVLGLGLGSRIAGEWMLGQAVGPPLASMREYLAVVQGLLLDGEVNRSGRWFSGHASYSAPRRPGLAVYVGAYGPRLLRLAGEVADGVLLWMCSPSYVRDQAVPAVGQGLARAGRQAAEVPIVVMLPAMLSRDRAGDREEFRRYLAGYVRMPSYRRLFVAQGLQPGQGGGDVSDDMIDALGAIGTAAEIRERIAEYREAGATAVAVSPVLAAHEHRAGFLDTIGAALAR